MLTRAIQKRPDKCKFEGRILFLTEDPELIRRQLAGEDLPWDTKNPQNNPKLRDDISTDEITPAHICFFFDEKLGEWPYTGLKCGNEVPIKRGDVKQGGFVAAVSGKRRGKGSSREQSPYAELCAGIQLVIAENIERIYKQNCQNLGVLTSTDFSLIDKVRAGQEIPLSKFTEGEDDITRQVIEYGGLFPFNVARMQKKVFLPSIQTDALSEFFPLSQKTNSNPDGIKRAEVYFRVARGNFNRSELLPRGFGRGRSDLFCHSERSEESLFGLGARKERFFGAQRASVHCKCSP